MTPGTRKAVAVLVAAMLSSVAQAQDKPAAEASFREGRRLLAAGKVKEACARFEMSMKLDPALGTLLNLADCHEREGRMATAWAEFKELQDRASSSGRTKFAKEAQRRAQSVESKLTRLVIKVARPTPDGLLVERNGGDVTAVVGIAAPVDPGTHEIIASAPGYRAFKTTVTASGPGETVEVEIPALEKEATRATAVDRVKEKPKQAVLEPAPERKAAPSSRGRRFAGLAIGGAGVAVIGTGFVFGALARNDWNESRARCDTNNVCDAEGSRLVDSSFSNATIATVLVPVGIAAVGAGVVVYLTSRGRSKSKSKAIGWTPVVGRRGLGVVGRF